jgi:hypothetical protein
LIIFFRFRLLTHVVLLSFCCNYLQFNFFHEAWRRLEMGYANVLGDQRSFSGGATNTFALGASPASAYGEGATTVNSYGQSYSVDGTNTTQALMQQNYGAGSYFSNQILRGPAATFGIGSSFSQSDVNSLGTLVNGVAGGGVTGNGSGRSSGYSSSYGYSPLTSVTTFGGGTTSGATNGLGSSSNGVESGGGVGGNTILSDALAYIVGVGAGFGLSSALGENRGTFNSSSLTFAGP